MWTAVHLLLASELSMSLLDIVYRMAWNAWVHSDLIERITVVGGYLVVLGWVYVKRRREGERTRNTDDVDLGPEGHESSSTHKVSTAV